MDMIKEYKALKDGVITPRKIVEEFIQDVKFDEVEDLIIVTVDKKGIVSTGFTTMHEYKALGMLEKSSRDISYFFDGEE